eukprot:COSAG06_NODE_17439_length_940_cov_12.604043_1_plen_100_part_10
MTERLEAAKAQSQLLLGRPSSVIIMATGQSQYARSRPGGLPPRREPEPPRASDLDLYIDLSIDHAFATVDMDKIAGGNVAILCKARRGACLAPHYGRRIA